MPCCGKAKRILKKSSNITVGLSRHIKQKKSIYTLNRMRICRKCIEQTWMTKLEYGKWLLKNGVKVLSNFDQLEKLPKLPKYDISENRRSIYCRICKCFIPAKAGVEDEICPKGKWLT